MHNSHKSIPAFWGKRPIKIEETLWQIYSDYVGANLRSVRFRREVKDKLVVKEITEINGCSACDLGNIRVRYSGIPASARDIEVI
jgi:hypothetical protein